MLIISVTQMALTQQYDVIVIILNFFFLLLFFMVIRIRQRKVCMCVLLGILCLFVLKGGPKMWIAGTFSLKLTYESNLCLDTNTCSCWQPPRGKSVVALDPPRVQVVGSAKEVLERPSPVWFSFYKTKLYTVNISILFADIYSSE